jgi:hypothetical protein
MTQEHPITPPEKLVDQWSEAWIDAKVKHEGLVTFVATQAARWGSDQELEACCEWIPKATPWDAEKLRAVRRPKPPSLKEQALLQLDTLNADLSMHGMGCDLSQIRRALESLPD